MHLNTFECGGSLPAPCSLVLTHPARLLGPSSLHPLALFLSQIAMLSVLLHLLICRLARELQLTEQAAQAELTLLSTICPGYAPCTARPVSPRPSGMSGG